jgi:Family of unknown function (DUF6210)
MKRQAQGDKEMSELKTIVLWSYHHPLLILPCTSGVRITNQTGGVSTNHPSVEGVLLPVPGNILGLVSALEDIHAGCGCSITDDEANKSITRDEADKIDAAFIANEIPFTVVRERLLESQEAWLFVRIRDKDECVPPVSEEFIYSSYALARRYNHNVSLEEIRAIHEADRTSMLGDFSGQEAILTWENCD